eukprot:scaffold57012_cov63-Cyclotella_meneghiniana.AAC.6
MAAAVRRASPCLVFVSLRAPTTETETFAKLFLLSVSVVAMQHQGSSTTTFNLHSRHHRNSLCILSSAMLPQSLQFINIVAKCPSIQTADDDPLPTLAGSSISISDRVSYGSNNPTVQTESNNEDVTKNEHNADDNVNMNAEITAEITAGSTDELGLMLLLIYLPCLQWRCHYL